jgi:hypothetical protein
VLNTVVSNLMVITTSTSGAVPGAAHRHETFSLGRTIVISRGLIDVLPDEASLAMVLADELAHISLGHRTETMFAFSDRLSSPRPRFSKACVSPVRPEIRPPPPGMTILGNPTDVSNAGLT